MIPCRILVIAPYESMKNILLFICKDRPEVRLTVMVGDLGEGARLVQEIDEEEFDIVISRGGTAEVLRSVVSIPVVEIQLSSYDVLSALKLAENYTGRYALVAYPNIARMATLLCSVLQYDVPIYPIAQGDTLEKTVDELIQRDVTLIIGDMVTTQYAKQHSLDAILITSGVESLENSIRQALQLHQLMTAVRVRDALLERQARQHQWELAVLQEDQTVFWESPSLARKPRLRKMMQKIAARADAAEGGVQIRRIQEQPWKISCQRTLLEKYAKEKGFENTIFLADDGYSGTNFERPSWKKIVEMIEAGQVANLIVKDASRLGREYLQVGYYMEIYFPQKNVRFIAVNDGVDSTVENSNDFNPIRNWANELHAKDTSRKVRAVMKMKAEQGERLGGRPPYGYRKSDGDANTLVPDEDTAPVVKRIFSLCAAGNGPKRIATILTKEQVVNPSNAYYRKTGKSHRGLDTTRPCLWSSNSVTSILNNEVYLGHSVGLRTTTISYKNKQRVERPESERFVVKNTHEALVFTAAVPVCCRIFEDLVFRADHTVIELVVDVSPPLMSALRRLRPLVRCG